VSPPPKEVPSAVPAPPVSSAPPGRIMHGGAMQRGGPGGLQVWDDAAGFPWPSGMRWSGRSRARPWGRRRTRSFQRSSNLPGTVKLTKATIEGPWCVGRIRRLVPFE
jgi:hypothetical protein